MSEEFAALDVETANPDLASVCQIGVVRFASGTIVGSWQSLLNPDDYFDPLNVSIHGINESTVRNAPRFPEVASDLSTLLNREVVASHSPFDRVAMTRLHAKYALPPIDCIWLDTAAVCRRAWMQFARRGYGLEDIASWCGIEFRHHDAQEDARAAGLILLRAIADSGLSVHDWIARVKQPIDPSGSRTTRTGSPDGPLAGEVIVFTGALSMPRREAADLAAAAGSDVAGSVTKTTSLLVVGDQDLRKLAGHQKSSKHRKAERLIAAGEPIRILGESDFLALVENG